MSQIRQVCLVVVEDLLRRSGQRILAEWDQGQQELALQEVELAWLAIPLVSIGGSVF